MAEQRLTEKELLAKLDEIGQEMLSRIVELEGERDWWKAKAEELQKIVVEQESAVNE